MSDTDDYIPLKKVKRMNGYYCPHGEPIEDYCYDCEILREKETGEPDDYDEVDFNHPEEID